MAKFAEGTEVPAGRSKAEIERILTRFGADQFGYGWRGDSAMVVFRAQGRHIRFVLPMPTKEDLRGSRSADAQEREERRRWRALSCQRSLARGSKTSSAGHGAGDDYPPRDRGEPRLRRAWHHAP